jgi:hypothetical protein
MEGQENQEKPIFLPQSSFCHPFAGRACRAIAVSSAVAAAARWMRRRLDGPQKIKVNQAKSNQIKVNQAILKHFYFMQKSILTLKPMVSGLSLKLDGQTSQGESKRVKPMWGKAKG